MMDFEFSTSNTILFGAGKIRSVGKIARTLGRSALVIAGKHAEIETLIASLKSDSIFFEVLRIHGEPILSTIQTILNQTNQNPPEVIIGMGGGSVLDTGKAVAALRTNPGDILDYLEVVGQNKPLMAPPLPFIAIPTTSGTGSEVTRNAVISVPSEKVKVSLRSPMMIPKVAILDPELTISTPQDVTASTGLDALTQVIEPFISKKANSMTDLYCREGFQKARTSLPAAYRDGKNLEARSEMMWVSLLGGLALANAGLGAVHGIAGPLGGMFDAPHGVICARLLPGIFLANYEALCHREPNSPVINRFFEISRILCDDPEAGPEEGAHWLASLVKELKVSGLSNYGVNPHDIPAIVAKAIHSSSMKANPVQLPTEILSEVILKAL